MLHLSNELHMSYLNLGFNYNTHHRLPLSNNTFVSINCNSHSFSTGRMQGIDLIWSMSFIELKMHDSLSCRLKFRRWKHV